MKAKKEKLNQQTKGEKHQVEPFRVANPLILQHTHLQSSQLRTVQLGLPPHKSLILF